MSDPRACANPRCDRPAPDGLVICSGCIRRTAMHLTDLAADLSAKEPIQ